MKKIIIYIFSLFFFVLSCGESKETARELQLRKFYDRIKIDTNNTYLHYEVGRDFYLKNNYTEAIEHFEKCIEIEPEYSDAYFGIFVSKLLQNPKLIDDFFVGKVNNRFSEEYLKAYSYFEKAIMFNPHFDWELGIKLLDVESNKMNSDEVNLFGKLKGTLKDFMNSYFFEVERQLDIIAEDEPDYIFHRFYRGLVNIIDINFLRGISELVILKRDLKQANEIRLLPFIITTAQIYHIVAFTYQDYGNFEKSILYYDNCLKEDPNFYIAYYFKSINKWNEKHADSALIFIDKALSLAEENPILNFRKGVFLQQNKNYEEAETYFQKAIELAPRYKNSYFNMAQVLEERKEFKKAIDYYRLYISRTSFSDRSAAKDAYNKALRLQRILNDENVENKKDK